MVLSVEQQEFIKIAKEGNNILVDACIGSGKTTAIHALCEELPEDKRILYLTYNKLLKLDAKSKIHCKNVTVTNYHGFAYKQLLNLGIRAGISDIIQKFNTIKPKIEKYDVLIIDEYQDIETELAELLNIIKSTNPTMQIVAVGDMQQKIYDKTTLDVYKFIVDFLDNYKLLEFTQCFRLSSEIASKLGRIWNKKIVGVNNDCIVETMSCDQVIDFLSKQQTKDVLCLGSRKGDLSRTLNVLEEKYPDIYNKKTVYASISDKNSTGATEPKKDSAIFTTYDSSKGLERKVLVIFDFTEDYWSIRANSPQQSYEILRNIFCVAASRGKNHIIFVKNDLELLSEKTLSTPIYNDTKFTNMEISSMFDFKYKEDVEKCFSLLKIKEVDSSDKEVIKIKNKDGLIDLSPCIGIYQEATYFDRYSIDDSISFYLKLDEKNKSVFNGKYKKSSLEEKILYLTSLETKQNRYINQVKVPFISTVEGNLVCDRLSTVLSRDEIVQSHCVICFSDSNKGKLLFSALGIADVVKDNMVYELKFVSELTHEHFLQCACYMIALKLKSGILWNTRNNDMYEIKIPNKKKFLDSVVYAITKGSIKKYNKPSSTELLKAEMVINMLRKE